MFKFLKSKKGFTLVELMIVVVIMAILVAVAVPIYSAVTKNARAKTCKGNRREIVAQITNSIMSDPSICKVGSNSSATLTVSTNDKGDGISGTVGAGDVFTGDMTFEKLFNSKNLPYCPLKGSSLTVTVKTGADAGSVEVTCECAGDEKDVHNA